MFQNLFSFEGRIRRTEYGISLIIYVFIAVFINLIAQSDREAGFIFILYIPALWFLWSQAAKRCHDVGNSGWWQLIPFYGLWLLFQDGDAGPNQYGDNPKGNRQVNNGYNPSYTNQQQPTNSNGEYNPGHYTGGHNNHNNNYDYSKNQSNSNNNNSSGEYKSGELYK